MSASGGPVVLCFGIVDEADLVGDFLEYHLALGVERFVATDVGSTDGTLDILSRYERAGRLHLTRLSNPAVRAEQRDWLTPMAAQARDVFGASWCLFCDPDEFWVFPEGDAPRYLRSSPAPIVGFGRYNLLPHAAPGGHEAAHHRQFDLVVRRPLEFLYDIRGIAEPGGIVASLTAQPPDILRFIGPKVAARANVIGRVAPGFHDVVATDPSLPRYREPHGYIGHFQVTGLARFINKARLVADFIAANPPEADPFSSRHWVRLAALYRHNLIEAEYARQILDEHEIAERLASGVLVRDNRVAARLAILASGRRDQR